MNPKLLPVVLLLILTFSSLEARVWRVNNNDESADFDDTDVAHDSNQVGNGDTLYVEGSVDTYSSFDCSKALTIIGPGYFLIENRPSANLFTARISRIDFDPGSEGAKVIGMTFDVSSTSGVSVGTDFISIERCYMNSYVSIGGGVVGVRVIGNYFDGIRDQSSTSFFDQVFFNNNIVTSDINLDERSLVATCYNNIFLADFISMRALAFRNNILTNSAVQIFINSSFIERNVGTNNVFGGDNINVNNINALFVGGDSFDGRYVLSAGSAAAGAGVGGVDCGIFGGDTPYVISGQPSLPIITVLDVDPVASEQSGLRVKITVISNQ